MKKLSVFCILILSLVLVAPVFAAQPSGKASEAPLPMLAINGDWVVDMEATAKVFKYEGDLLDNLVSLTVSFDVVQSKISTVFADKSGETLDYKVLGSTANGVRLLIGGNHEVEANFSQAGRLIMTEQGSSIVFIRKTEAE